METEKTIEQQQSVEIAVNAKGQWSGKVKIYSETIEDAYMKAHLFGEQLERKIKEKNGL